MVACHGHLGGHGLSREDLLRPTLSTSGDAPALYTTQGFFFASMFGGPLGALIYGAFNTFRLRRLAQDLPLIVAIAAAGYFLMLQLNSFGWLDQVAAFIGSRRARGDGLVLRAIGLLCFAAIYFMHRKYYRAGQVAGRASMPGWVPGIIGVVVGYVANAEFVKYLLAHHP
jgi:hypothetical protein